MRHPSLPSILRSFTLANLTRPIVQHFHSPSVQLFQQSLAHKFTPIRSVPTLPTLPFMASLFTSAQKKQDTTEYDVKKSDGEWQAVLSPEQFRVIREKGTEAPFTGEYDKHMPDAGVYTCAACSAPLYRASHKFKSGCGWPAYFDSIPGAVERHTDSTFGMARTEIVCAKCGGHLGHIFKGEGYPTPTDERHCVNSVSLKFSEEDEKRSK